MSAVKASDAAIALLKEFEQGPKGGFASVAYRDWAGHPTIGWGHRILPGEDLQSSITAEEADRLLADDLDKLAAAVSTGLFGCPKPKQCMVDAVLCLGFNIGIGALLGSTLMFRLRAGDWAAAADEFIRWNKATNPQTGRKEPLAGLTRRREAERALFLRDGFPG